MSFASEVREELCKINSTDLYEMRAELYGFLLFANSFKYTEIVFSTENIKAARRFCNLLSECTGSISEMTSIKTNKKSGAYLHTVTVPDSEDIKNVFAFVMHMEKELNLRINKAIIDDREYACSFLRGVFLCCGSVSDPEREYHMEFVVPYLNLTKDLCSVIKFIGEGIGEKEFKSGYVMRKSNYVVYIKDKDTIAEMLALMGAYNANIKFIQEIIHKDIINRTNRKINSEIANSNKTAKVAAIQLEAIEKIKKNNLFDTLPDDLKELAMLRIENPEMSLRELGDNLSIPISRSGVNHRMDRILKLAQEIK